VGRILSHPRSPIAVAQLLTTTSGDGSFHEFENIYGMSLEAAEALYFEDAPYGYPSLYGCDAPELTEVAGVWTATTCAAVCAALGPAYVSDGWCTAEGTPCDLDTLPVCVDATSIAWCIDAIWVFEDCAAACEGPAAECVCA